MSEELRKRVEDLARENRRSLHAEIIALIEYGLDKSTNAPPDMDTFAEDIAERVAAKLRKK